ncbi:PAP2-domain-containing protein [Rickenella mellea]|uniref:PAP2-domain-containing protein n=1 Tax=Rickenella mellea TaxID=50990 RepID=A0A4Y7QG03_9AGAM|nr:PAP2-domain-containing protein [Rickenella mellea]
MAMNPAPLELTHVLYDADSPVSLAFALVTLSPVLLMASYAALAVVTRDLLIINMWAGQLACEAINLFIKRIVRQERPAKSYGSGYGFPSSHSQYMGYFSSFLLLHLLLRHRFASTGSWFLDAMRIIVFGGAIVAWAGSVCYSRYHLTYHTAAQILWGVVIGILLGTTHYTLTELLPFRQPYSLAGRLRATLLESEICTWLRVRDGWAVWADGGDEAGWKLWRERWDARRRKKV